MIPSPSAEQESFLEAAATDHVLGDCVAGSGKTTTVLLLAQRYPALRILQVTYNSQLKSEVRAKALAAGLDNLEIHTYHSLARSYYIDQGYDDGMIKRVLDRNMPPRRPLPPVGIFVLDETQDMGLSYYALLRKFLGELKVRPRMVVLGDRYQGIYGFKGADTRFLTLAPELWDWSEFCPLTLSTSYRVTRPIATFVNRCMLGYERLRAERAGKPVDYVLCNPFAVHKWLARKLCDMIASGTCKAEDIFILANTIKNPRAPVRALENCLVEAGIPCYFPTSEDRIADDDILDGKVVFSTFHQAKGRERAVVVVYGFDASYQKFQGCSDSRGGQEGEVMEEDVGNGGELKCPETLYVAATRAKEHLILLQSVTHGPLKFLQELRASPFLNVIQLQKGGASIAVKEDIRAYFAPAAGTQVHVDTVTNLTRFLNESALNSLTAIVNEVFVEEATESYKVPITGKIASGVGWEDVTDINGLVIPAMYEARFCSQEHAVSTIEVDVRRMYDTFTTNGTQAFFRQACATLPDPVRTVEEFLRLGVLYASLVEQLYNRIQQITCFDWLTEQEVEACFKVLRPHIHADTIFEQFVEVNQAVGEFGRVHLTGRLDAVNDDCIWEIKCVETLAIEHFVQVLLYAWIWRQEYIEDHGHRTFRIVNLRTGQIYRLLDAEIRWIEEAVQIVFGNKWGARPVLNDTEFLEVCRNPGKPQHTNTNATSKKESQKPSGCCIVDDEDS